jgi:hypothetical protein
MASALVLGVGTLLVLDRMVPWFQRVVGGLAVWRERLRSSGESWGGFWERGGGRRGLVLMLLLLLRLRTRRKSGGSSSSSSTVVVRGVWLKYLRVGLADAGGVGSGWKRVAHTWLGSWS